MSLKKLISDYNFDNAPELNYVILKNIENIFLEDPVLIKGLDAETGSKLLGDRLFVNNHEKITEHLVNYREYFTLLQKALVQKNVELAESLLKNGEKIDGPKRYMDSLVNLFLWKQY